MRERAGQHRPRRSKDLPMGERGPLPAAVKRRRNKTPDPIGAIRVRRPAKPKTITGEAAAEWDRVVPEIEKAGFLAVLDRAVLIRYCTAWADWCDLTVKVEQTGKLVKGMNGLMKNPLWTMRNEAEATLSDLGKQLGLSPVARRRLDVKHEPETDDVTPTGVTVMAGYRERLAK